MEPGCSISTITGSDKRPAFWGHAPLMLPAIAAKVAVVAPAATVTEAGAVNALLLDSATLAPPAGACEESVTVQVEVTPLPNVVVATNGTENRYSS